MLRYIFITAFILIYALSFFKIKNSRSPALIMLIGYVLYICFIHPVVYQIVKPVSEIESAHLYFLLLGVLDTCIGLFMCRLYLKNKNQTAKYIAYLEFFSVINHLCARIVYYPGWSKGDYYSIYQNTSILIVLSIMIVMLWPLIHGPILSLLRLLNRVFYRKYYLGFVASVSVERNTKVEIKENQGRS